MPPRWSLDPDRLFSAESSQRASARELYALVRDLPIVSPHGHVDPALLADPDARFGSPADLFVLPDHYVCRMLHSRGVPMEDLGLPTRDGTRHERGHRRVWQRFADHFYVFRGTPSGLWLSDVLLSVFGVTERLDGKNAQRIYDHLAERLEQPAFSPRALYEKFQIRILCTTDGAADSLEHHRRLQSEGRFDVRPTFRPDAVVHLGTPGFRDHIERLGVAAGIDITTYADYIRALEERRATFKALGATATDHGAVTPHAERLGPAEAERIFLRALRGEADEKDAARFSAHMLMEMARMSLEDGLVMQLHAGSLRDHHGALFTRFGPDRGADIPVATEWTRNLRPLLETYGDDPRFRLLLFTLDESTYGRELAPLAGYYPAVLLGPPWWFFDSPNGMVRFLDQVTETAGLYNTAGFTDDTRAFCSIPARHDVWRRVSCNWLAGLVVTGRLDAEEAAELATECAVGLAERAYRLGAEDLSP
ncbi:glucuronate isomerase [Polyangium sorediatum]|uniref:Uronate isomerase n=1 Tax=Polyangium sorediatum TaxID=889274 RepID=A0ABT6P8V3_9BACT|nr:glucuronate isomerase [Polyangium sorediatum]MDI1436953.1 glucuronate isomerase [Polyangium sorediatum]